MKKISHVWAEIWWDRLGWEVTPWLGGWVVEWVGGWVARLMWIYQLLKLKLQSINHILVNKNRLHVHKTFVHKMLQIRHWMTPDWRPDLAIISLSSNDWILSNFQGMTSLIWPMILNKKIQIFKFFSNVIRKLNFKVTLFFGKNSSYHNHKKSITNQNSYLPPYLWPDLL